MSNPLKIVWTRFGVVPGKVAGGAGTKRETARLLKPRCDFYIHTHKGIYDWYREFGIDVKPYRLLTGGKGYGSIPFLLMCMIKTVFSKTSGHMDIVASRNHDLFDLFPALLLKFRTKGKLAVYIQSRLLPEWGSRSFITWLLVFIERAIGLILTRIWADAIVLNNHAPKRTLLKFGFPRDQMFVVYPGVFAKDIARIAPTGDVLYDGIFFGRVTKSKGIFDLLDAWREVSTRIPGAKLAVVGDYETGEGEEIQQFIQRYGLGKVIEVQGPVSGDERYRRLKQAKIFIQPSYVEQWSISLGEAVACLLPAVVYDIPTTRSTWGETISYARLGDRTDLAKKIIDALENKQTAQTRAQEAHNLVQYFTWERFRDSELDAMESIHAGRVSQESIV
jgi:glycosyltransferase involved in cell wall biosynthesis